MSDLTVAGTSLPSYFSEAPERGPDTSSALLRGADPAPYSHHHVVTMPHLDVESDMTYTIRPRLSANEASR